MTSHLRSSLAFLVTMAMAAVIIVALQVMEASAADICLPPDGGPQQVCVLLDDGQLGVIHNQDGSLQTAAVLTRICTDEAEGVLLTTALNAAISQNFFAIRAACPGHHALAVGAGAMSAAAVSSAAAAPADATPAADDGVEITGDIEDAVGNSRCIATGGDDEVCLGVFLDKDYTGVAVTQPRAGVIRTGALVARDCDGEGQGLDLVVVVEFAQTDLSIPSDELCGGH